MKIVSNASANEYDGYILVPALIKYTTDGKARPLYLGINKEWIEIRSCYQLSSFASRIEYRCTFVLRDRIYDKKVIYNPTHNCWYVQNY